MSLTRKALIVLGVITVIPLLTAVFHLIWGDYSKYPQFLLVFLLMLTVLACFFYLRTTIEGDTNLRRLGKYIIGILTTGSFVLDYIGGRNGAAGIGYFLILMYIGMLCFLFYAVGYCVFERRNHGKWRFGRIVAALLLLILSMPITFVCLLATNDAGMPRPVPSSVVVEKHTQ